MTALRRVLMGLLVLQLLTLVVTGWFGWRSMGELRKLRADKVSLTGGIRQVQLAAPRYSELLVKAEGQLSQCRAY